MWQCVAALIGCMASVSIVQAADSTEAEPVAEVRGFASPKSLLNHFMKSMHEGDLDAAMTCMDLETIPPGVRSEIGERFTLELALVLERLQCAEMPDATKEDLFTVASTGAGEIVLRCRTGRGNERLWQFSSETIELMPRIFRSVMVLPPMAGSLMMQEGGPIVNAVQWRAPEIAVWLEMPMWLKHHIGGFEMYQWIGLAMIAMVSWVVSQIVGIPLRKILHRIAGRSGMGNDNLWQMPIHKSARAASWMVALKAAEWTVLLLALPLATLDNVLVGIKIVNLVLFTILGLTLIDFAGTWIRQADRAAAGQRAMDDLLVASGVRIAKIILVIVVVIWVVSILGAQSSVNRLLAGLGIGGIAFALALQEPLKNFFSSLVLAADRPFGVGDTLSFEGVKGKVEHVGFRTTILRTKLNTRLVVPNTTLVSTKLDTHGGNALKEFNVVLPIAFQADDSALQTLRVRVVDLLNKEPGVQQDSIEVGIVTLGVHGIEFGAKARFAKGAKPLWSVFGELNMQVLAIAKQLGLPLQTFALRSDGVGHTGP